MVVPSVNVCRDELSEHALALAPSYTRCVKFANRLCLVVFMAQKMVVFLRVSMSFLVIIASAIHLRAQEPYKIRRCEIVPLADHQVSFRVAGVERTKWHFGDQYPRPFFFPLLGPSGQSLTRMGHPGAPNHDHHQSVWFAHHDVEGQSFWANGKDTTVRQKQWISYVDGDDEAIMAVELGWVDGEQNELLHQVLCAAVIPMSDEQYALEVQSEFTPGAGRANTQIGKTNFGFFAVRVARSLSVVFGDGRLQDSEGRAGEPEIFGKHARWMDYSGPIAANSEGERKLVVEGITFHDHPANPTYPTSWHVRSDGWMGASLAMEKGLTIAKDSPLRLRYLLHVHSGPFDQERAEEVHQAFSQRPGFEIVQRPRPHHHAEVRRIRK